MTRGQVPVLLSSSFAFIAPIISVREMYGTEFALGGIVIAGVLYLVFAGIIAAAGVDAVLRLFPTTVTSTMVILIGLVLAPVAVKNASENWGVAGATFVVAAAVKGVFGRNIIGSLSVLIAIFAGYVLAVTVGMVDFSLVARAELVARPASIFPAFSWPAISLIAPVALVTALEHVADISAVGRVTEKDFLREPGVHRTLIGDGLATSIAGLLGGCANTTYSENIGALEMTGVKKPVTLRITALLLILLAFLPKLTAYLHSIPSAVIGGVSILLFGLISANGVKGLIAERVDMRKFHNVIVVASMLIVGTGGTVIAVGTVEVSSLAAAAVVGIALNFAFSWRYVLFGTARET